MPEKTEYTNEKQRVYARLDTGFSTTIITDLDSLRLTQQCLTKVAKQIMEDMVIVIVE